MRSGFRELLDDYSMRQYEEENLYTLDWVDKETLEEMIKFITFWEEKYGFSLNIVFLLLIGMDFMAYRLDCNSCPVREEYFLEFEQFILKKASKYEKQY